MSLLLLLTAGLIAFTTNRNSIDDQILAYTVDTKSQDLQLFWKNDKGEIFKNIQIYYSSLSEKEKLNNNTFLGSRLHNPLFGTHSELFLSLGPNFVNPESNSVNGTPNNEIPTGAVPKTSQKHCG